MNKPKMIPFPLSIPDETEEQKIRQRSLNKTLLDEYLANGGAITVLPRGASNDDLGLPLNLLNRSQRKIRGAS